MKSWVSATTGSSSFSSDDVRRLRPRSEPLPGRRLSRRGRRRARTSTSSAARPAPHAARASSRQRAAALGGEHTGRAPRPRPSRRRPMIPSARPRSSSSSSDGVDPNVAEAGAARARRRARAPPSAPGPSASPAKRRPRRPRRGSTPSMRAVVRSGSNTTTAPPGRSTRRHSRTASAAPDRCCSTRSTRTAVERRVAEREAPRVARNERRSGCRRRASSTIVDGALDADRDASRAGELGRVLAGSAADVDDALAAAQVQRGEHAAPSARRRTARRAVGRVRRRSAPAGRPVDVGPRRRRARTVDAHARRGPRPTSRRCR